MGLLDGLLGSSWDDPKSAGMLQLAAGLLGPGGLGTGLSRGLLGYQGAIAADTENKLKRAQTEDISQNQQMRALQVQQMQRKLNWAQQFADAVAQNGGGAIAQVSQNPSQPAGVSTSGQYVPAINTQGPTPAAAAKIQPSRFASLTPDQMFMGMNSGMVDKDQYDLWKTLSTGVSMGAGTWRVIPGETPSYLPDPTKGIAVSNGSVVPMPGAASTLGAIAAATKEGETKGANTQTLMTPENRERLGLTNAPAGLTIGDVVSPNAPTGTPSSIAPVISADMRRNGIQPSSASWNGITSGATGGFKTAAQLAGEKVSAEKAASYPYDKFNKYDEDNKTFLKTLADTTNNEADIVARNERIKPLLADIPKSGGFGYEQRLELANNLKNSGIPGAETFSKMIISGDPAAAKTVANQLSAAALQTMLDTLNKEGKPNKAIFLALQKEQEALGHGKDVLQNVMNLQKQLYDQHMSQLNKATDLIASPEYGPHNPGSAVRFQLQFAGDRQKSINEDKSSFGSEADVNNAILKGAVKKGDRITVNGRSAVVE